MLNQREMVDHAALTSERCRCIVLLAACGCFAVGFAALALLCSGRGCWDLIAIVGVADALATVHVLWRLARITRRLEALEKYL